MGTIIEAETLRHRVAFDYYYSLGNARSVSKVAEEIGVSAHSVKRWSKSFHWQERVKSKDIQISTKLDEITDKAVEGYRKRIEGIINQLIDDCIVIDKETGKPAPAFTVSNVQDFEKVVKLYLLLSGEPTDRSEVANTDARQIILARLNRLQSSTVNSSN